MRVGGWRHSVTSETNLHPTQHWKWKFAWQAQTKLPAVTHQNPFHLILQLLEELSLDCSYFCFLWTFLFIIAFLLPLIFWLDLPPLSLHNCFCLVRFSFVLNTLDNKKVGQVHQLSRSARLWISTVFWLSLSLPRQHYKLLFQCLSSSSLSYLWEM